MKKAITAILLLAVAAAAVVLGMRYYPGEQPVSGTRLAAPVRPVLRSEEAQSPADTVVSYIQALEEKKYETAYRLLSKPSQEKHTYDDFVAQVEKTGVTEYDLASARLKERQGERATVEVQLREDPSSAGFALDNEKGEWRVVYVGGIPSFPYP